MLVGVRGTVVRTMDGPIEQIDPWEWYWSTHNERKRHIGPDRTVSILLDLELDIRSVMFPAGYGYIDDGAIV